ncbi:enoyl-CoA hydratase/isomerase family protein [Rhizohabitans arisaemae]|uniref:enoyl-CoA hydratase/isomerase family protein n=1 Tax=Rhizohabitans arisaemae TaxID=2720610 RepID=UPI0024B06F25|nr:enoyl-CoA hydratase/isomerase family protein [Rhizohabitans arisaemae]
MIETAAGATPEDDRPGLLTSRRGNVAVLTLNRPHIRNALNGAMLDALEERLTLIAEDDSLRAVVLTGAGTSFCSGEDLAVAKEGGETFARSIRSLQRVTRLFFNLGKPVVGALNGPAVGGGLELALSCDVRLASPAFFCSTPETRLGLILSNGASVLLPLLIGQSRARRMLFSGARMDADWCHRAGLIDEIVPGDLQARALEIAAELSSGGPLATAATRRLLNAPLYRALTAALDDEEETCIDIQRTAEAAEGLAAYRGAREPSWRT